MRARSISEVASRDEAHALLGLSGTVDAVALKTAFRAAVKAARPDQGGDAARYRKIIAAWRLLQADTSVPTSVTVAPEPALPVIPITPRQALKGGTATVTLAGRLLKVRVSKGVRSGDLLRLKGGAADGGDLKLPVLIRGDDGLSAVGDDLYMDWPVTPRLLEDGGRVEIQTHAGPRSAWLTPGQQTLRLRLKDLGLPARRTRPQGHLFVTLIPAADAPSPTEDRLARFTRVWTPDRLAA
ncbi:MAG: J domain-containing protein [Brevundimonas sp.]|nr:MAG: J domain-containing protein [Brevundimonas sp.]